MPRDNQQRRLIFRGISQDFAINKNSSAAVKNQIHVSKKQPANQRLKGSTVSYSTQQLFEFGLDVIPLNVGLNAKNFPFLWHFV